VTPDPLLVLVSGCPGSGKSTLARRLAGDLRMPLLAKDTIKEALGDALVVESVEGSMEVGAAAVDALFALTAAQLDLGVSVIVESAFQQDRAGAVLPLVEQSTAVIVHCTAPREVLRERVADREDRGDRHPVHLDGARVIDWDRYGLMELLDVAALIVDTADGYRPDYPTIVSFVDGAR
jgi:predicted kinase